jgi:methylmalonyl-CoA mutase
MQITDQWLKAAKAELDGADPFEKLTSAKGNIRVKPWYDRFDVQKDQTFVLPAEKSGLGARSWVNAPLIMVKDAADANKNALRQLAAGADGIVFQLNEDADPGVLLENIQLAYCSVFFKGLIQEEFTRDLLRYAEPTGIHGAFYHDNPVINNIDSRLDTFRTDGFLYPETNESPEIALAKLLSRFVEHFERSRNVSRAMDNVAVLIEAGNDFFLEIARLKALRVLWNGLRKAYDMPGKQLAVHATISPWISQSYQPHGNMIAATSRTLSAVLGGCNAVTVIAEDATSLRAPTLERFGPSVRSELREGDADTNANRVARNVSLVLRDEAHVSKTGDATAGSYYIDHLVREIVEKSWAEFQKLQR